MKQRSSICAAVVALSAVLLFGQSVNAQQLTQPKSLESFVEYVQSHHRAPFDRDNAFIPPEAAAKFMNKPELKLRLNASLLQTTNIKVNQDRNPWPKAEVGAAVDPVDGGNYVVMTNDFRENFDHQFYHSSTDGGKTWSDDSMVGGADPLPALFR